MVRNDKIVAAICVASLVAAIYATYIAGGRPLTANTFAGAVGQAIAFALLPLVVALPWNTRTIKSGGSSRGPIKGAVAIFIFESIAFLLGHNAQEEKSAAQRTALSVPYTFTGQGCDVIVTFPSQPKITKSKLVGLPVESEQAELIGEEEGIMFRSECVPLSSEALFSEHALTVQLEQYAATNGLRDPTYTAGHDDRAISGTLRGYKDISNVPTTYEMRMLITKKSVVTLTAGGPTEGYPQKGINEFLQSARLIIGP